MPVSFKKPDWYIQLTRRAKRLKRQVWALFLAWKDPRTPVLARIITIVTVAYAVSPIDLIPDFIPFFGQLDDLVIVPALIVLALKLIPREVTARCRREAWKHMASRDRIKTPAAAVAGVVFVMLWLALLSFVVTRFV